MISLLSYAWIMIPPLRNMSTRNVFLRTNSPAAPIQEASIKDDVYRIIDKLISSYSESSAVDPKILIEQGHILTKGLYYEESMDDLLNSCDGQEAVAVLEAVDEITRNFVISERKSRSRWKLNYLMAGATSSRLEEAVTMLSETDELDENLVRFIDGLLQRKISMATGLNMDTSNEYDDDKATISSVPGRNAIDVLTLIRKRIDAEMKMKGNKDLRLLALLNSESEPEKISYILKSEISTVESYHRFSSFLEEAINHMTRSIQDESSDKVDGKTKDERINTIQKLREVRRELDSLLDMLKTGLKDESDVYSTSSDDYFDKLKEET